MSIRVQDAIFAALRSLVGDRCYPDVFKQNTTFPAIRVSIISAVPGPTICDAGSEATADYRVQIDIVARTGVDRDHIRSLALEALAAMPIPTTIDSWDSSYDIEAKAYVSRIDVILQPSSEIVSSP